MFVNVEEESSMYNDEKKLLKKVIIGYVSIVLSIIGLISYFIFAQDSVKKIQDQEGMVIQWYDQLPEDHWLKQEDTFNTRDMDLEMLSFYNFIKGSISPMLDISAASMKLEGGMFGKMINMAYTKEKKKDMSEYILKNSENKTIYRTFHFFQLDSVKLKVGASEQLSFNKGGTELLFDCTEENFAEVMYGELRNNFVFSYVKNPNIAKIFNGNIVGLKKGKTSLILNVGIYQFEYDVIVK